MAVAKSYEKMALSGDPFVENGKMYVNVIAPKGLKKVRWYSDAEYKRMYPNAILTHDVMDFNAKHVFGFEETGYITIYKGSNVEGWANEDRTHIYFNLTFGFYTPGQYELPHLIDGIEPVRLMWEDVVAHNDRMKPHTEVQKIVAAKLGTLSKSVYQGAVNEWLQKKLTVREKKSNETHFGTKHSYVLEDSEGNSYIWETGAKDFASGQAVSLKMKVKAHEEINGVPTTIVWYCKEI